MENKPPAYAPPKPVIEGAAKKRALTQILFVMLMDIIGLTILIPVAPSIVARYSTDAFTVTLLSGIYAAASFFAAPALGNISDRVGRRPVLLISVLGSAIGYFIFGIGGALWVLFLSRLIDGVTGGNFSTATAYIADVSTPEERPKNFALIGIAFGVGFVLGPALSAFTSLISVDAPAYTAGFLALLSFGMMYFVLPESHPPERRARKPLTLSSFNPLVSIAAIAAKPGMPLLLVISCIFAFAFNGINSVFAKYVGDKFTVSPTQIAIVFVVGGIVTAIVQGTLVERLVSRFGEKTMTIASLLGLGLGVVIAAVVPLFWMIFPTALLRNGLGGFFWATMGAMTANRVEPREQGQLAGVNSALQNLMAAIGPLAAGAAYDTVSPASPLWIGALILAVGAAFTLGVEQRRRNRMPA